MEQGFLWWDIHKNFGNYFSKDGNAPVEIVIPVRLLPLCKNSLVLVVCVHNEIPLNIWSIFMLCVKWNLLVERFYFGNPLWIQDTFFLIRFIIFEPFQIWIIWYCMIDNQFDIIIEPLTYGFFGCRILPKFSSGCFVQPMTWNLIAAETNILCKWKNIAISIHLGMNFLDTSDVKSESEIEDNAIF